MEVSLSLKKKRYQAIQEHRSTHPELEQELLSEDKKKYDPAATTEDCIADLRGIQERNPDAFVTRRFYRQHGRYSDSTWDSRFGTFAEFRRQAGLELSRGQSALEKRIAKHSSLDVYRGFAEVEVLPWVSRFEKPTGSRWQDMIVASDFHDTDCDPFALEVFLETCKRLQPSIVCLAGDLYDNYEFSRFDKDPRQCDIAGRLSFARDRIIRPIRESLPDTQIDLLFGNHEYHLLRHMAERTPEMRTVLSDFMGLSMVDILGIKELEVNIVSKHDLAAFKAADIRDQIQKNRKTYFNSITVSHYPDPKFDLGTNWVGGHSHKPMLYTSSNELLGGLWGVTNGCMANVDASYVEKSRDQNGFSIAYCDSQSHNSQVDQVVFSDGFVTVAGVRYFRPSKL